METAYEEGPDAAGAWVVRLVTRRYAVSSVVKPDRSVKWLVNRRPTGSEVEEVREAQGEGAMRALRDRASSRENSARSIEECRGVIQRAVEDDVEDRLR